MTAGEAAAILSRAHPADPLVVLVDGVWREVEAILPLQSVIYLPTDGLVARGPAVGVRIAE